MSKKSEDNLESFFRKAVNQSDSSFMERDWRAMEKKLDEDPITGTFYRNASRTRKIVVTTTAMAVLFAAYFFTFRTDQPLVGVEDSTNQQAAASVEVPRQQDEDKKENQTADLLPPATTRDITSPGAEGPRMAPSSAGSQRLTTASDAEEVKRPLEHRMEPAVPPADQMSMAIHEQTNLTVPSVSQSITSDRNQAALPATTATTAAAEKEPVKQEPISPLSEEEAAEDTDVKESDDTNGSKRSRWNIALSMAPDFSTTSLRNYSSPGSAVGILVGYQLHKRLSINVGLMRSSKRYTGYGNDYQPPYGYWKARTNGVVPNEIYGSCRILEIPLIIQYDILQRNRSRVFAGGGISTYLMSDEQYQYSFSAPNPGADQGWSSEGATSSYPLAIGHVSFGYERQISPRVNVGIEPFLKVPFAGIGWTDIQLFSTGAFVNVRYRLARSPWSGKSTNLKSKE